MRNPFRPTPEAVAAAARFNDVTGWYAATPVNNRVVIRVDPAKCEVLTDAYIDHTDDGTTPEGKS